MLKLSGAWLCGLYSVPQGSGLSRLRSSEENDAYWQPWEVNKDLFDCMRVYYKEQADSNVKCYELGGDCQSDDKE